MKKKQYGHILRAKRPAMFRGYCEDIAVDRGLKVFERDGLAWATDGISEWVFHRPLNPKLLWFEAWQIIYDDPSLLDQPQAFSENQISD